MPLLDERLKAILVCPCPHHADLTEDEAASQLSCTRCHLKFEVDEGLPIMMLEAAIVTAAYDASQCGAPAAVPGDFAS